MSTFCRPGPIESCLRDACGFWPDVPMIVALAGMHMGARRVIYDCCNGRGLAQVMRDGDMPDVLSEAIEAAEALGL